MQVGWVEEESWVQNEMFRFESKIWFEWEQEVI